MSDVEKWVDEKYSGGAVGHELQGSNIGGYREALIEAVTLLRPLVYQYDVEHQWDMTHHCYARYDGPCTCGLNEWSANIVKYVAGLEQKEDQK